MWEIFGIVLTIVAGLKPLVQAQEGAVALQALTGTDIPGNDLQCGQEGRTTCRVCGELTFVVSRCSAYPQCVAFNFDGSCGYLKTATGPTKPREGFKTYIPGKSKTTASGASPSLPPQASPTATPAAAAPATPTPAAAAEPIQAAAAPAAAAPPAAATASPSPAAATPVSALVTTDIAGSDVDCGQGGGRCRLCGDINSVTASCRNNPSCVAFTFDGSCGFLKSAAGPTTYREGYTTFVLSNKAAAPPPAAAPASPSPAAAAAPTPAPPVQVAAAAPAPSPSPSPSPSPKPSTRPRPSPSPSPSPSLSPSPSPSPNPSPSPSQNPNPSLQVTSDPNTYATAYATAIASGGDTQQANAYASAVATG